ncbi:MAG TPA: protein kinase [Vicinamibacterales bacterium]|nr:protein kinase [Vicinamibacterales bacterium]
MEPWTGGTHVGRYVLVAPVGAGGMGEVWRASDPRVDRVVAIKRLNARHSARFEQEARVIASLNHPHICQLYDVGADYLVLELLDGAPVVGPMPPAEAVALGIQIAGALEEAHRKGIIHRDLKPANIFRTRSGAKVLDFGLAKVASAGDPDVTRTSEGTVVGTAAYMSPEQAEGKPLDTRSDIFSFGVVLYEMISGRRAFDGDSAAQAIAAVLRDEAAPLDVAPALARIVTRCLRKSPAERFQTVTEVREALERVSTKKEELSPSIAVLPFADMSAGRDHEWFSDGLAEEIINLLAHIPGLKVIARTSAFAFKGQQQDVRRIAETLGVAHVLEGSVRKAGSRVRVTAQLIAAADGRQLWSDRYDREMEDVFAVQDEIAAAIAAVLQVKLSAESSAPRRYTPDLPAYEAVLKARHLMSTMTRDQLAKARELYEESITLDSGYALPHSELGWYYFNLASFGMRPAREAQPLARKKAERALEIDPTLAEAHALLGLVASIYDYDWREAERRFRLARMREPVPSLVSAWYGQYLAYVGRLHEGVAELERAVAQDPLNLYFRLFLERILALAGREADAASECRRLLEIDPKSYLATFHLALLEFVGGRDQEARALTEATCALVPLNPVARGALAGLLKRSGDEPRAAAEIAQLGDGSAYHTSLGFFMFHLMCAEWERAADWAAKAIEQREPTTLFFLKHPMSRDLRASARWPELARMMNLRDSSG